MIRIAVLIGVAASGLVFAQPQTVTPVDSRLERHRAVALRWFEEGFNRHALAVVDDIFVERVTVNGAEVGHEGVKQNMARHFRAFPDLRVTIDETLAEGDKVGVWYTVEATHRGEFDGAPPTGKRVRWSGFDLFTMDGGKIARARFLSDAMGLMQQLR